MMDAMFDSWDEDNDGTAIDDGFAWGTNLVGNLMAGVGGVIGLAGGATPVGLGGALLAGAGLAVGSDAAVNSMEEVGDFTADLFGWRGDRPYKDEEIGDLHYKQGRTDGWGQQLNRQGVGDAILGGIEGQAQGGAIGLAGGALLGGGVGAIGGGIFGGVNGAVGGGIAGALAGGTLAGPLGAIVGGVGGAVGGGLLGGMLTAAGGAAVGGLGAMLPGAVMGSAAGLVSGINGVSPFDSLHDMVFGKEEEVLPPITLPTHPRQ